MHVSSMFQLIFFSTCVAAALAVPSGYSSYGPAASIAYDQSVPTPYNFEYSVHDPHTKDVKSQAESGDGHGNVHGYYSVLESDGTTRVVDYSATAHGGFNAEVKKHGAPVPVVVPAYQSAPVVAPVPQPAPVVVPVPHSVPVVAPVYQPAPVVAPIYHSAPVVAPVYQSASVQKSSVVYRPAPVYHSAPASYSHY